MEEIIAKTKEEAIQIIVKCSDVQDVEVQLKLLTLSLRYWEDGESVENSVALAAAFLANVCNQIK